MMTNVYPGNCARCGAHVPGGTGIAERGADGRWIVRHPSRGPRSCAKAEPVAVEAAPPAEWMPARYPGTCSRCGNYEASETDLEYSRLSQSCRHASPARCERARADAAARAAARAIAREAVREAARARRPRPAQNSRADDCSACGGRVAPGDGTLWFDDAGDEDGDHSFCFWAEQPVLRDTRYSGHVRTSYAVRHADDAVCDGNKRAFDAREAAARAAFAAREAARHRLEAAMPHVSADEVEPAAPDCEHVQVGDPGLRILGSDEWILVEPEGAEPRRILSLTYRGADGDAWGRGNYAWNTTARVAPWSAQLADDARGQAFRAKPSDPFAGYVEPGDADPF